MKHPSLYKSLTFLFFMSLIPWTSRAQGQGLDDRINEAFTPIANWWGGVVLHDFPGTSIPTIIVLLVGGAMFFTIYFGFVNVRRFSTAIQTVRGKYDAIDLHQEGSDDLAIEGAIKGIIKDDSQEGEVSHFQALSSALSATVGLGNIAGVAIAVSLGGPGAIFWMIIAGFLGMSSKFTECTLGQKYRTTRADGRVMGGAMFYLQNGLAEVGDRTGGVLFKPLGKFLAVAFAILCIGGSFGGGNTFQVNQSLNAVQESIPWLGDHRWVFGLIMTILTGLVIIGGRSISAQYDLCLLYTSDAADE